MKYIISILVFILTSCGGNCDSLNKKFSTYDDAISTVRNTRFSIDEKVNTNSSWIESIEFFSCDGKSGFLILTTLKGQSYIHSQVPMGVWEGFKNATSYGRFYNSYIRGQYYLRLNIG